MELLYEIGTEEMPAFFVNETIKILPHIVEENLKTHKLNYSKIWASGTPRRLVVFVDGMDKEQPSIEEEILGPSIKIAYDENGNLTQAVLKFAEKQGVQPSELKVVRTPKGERIAIKKLNVGEKTLKLLPSILLQIFKQIPLPKSMYWHVDEGPFIRPIHWILAIFGGEVVPLQFAGCSSSNKTRGHRFMFNKDIEVTSFGDYTNKLKDAFVIVDHELRKQILKEQLSLNAQRLEGNLVNDNNLLDEVNFLIESPYIINGSFDPNFLKIPSPVIISTMKKQQRYFAILDNNKNLKPHFLAAANTKVNDPEVIKIGYEKVLRARLADAKFFYESDRKKSLIDFSPKLSQIVFHELLGTYADKIKKISKLALYFSDIFNYENKKLVERASNLIKADLKTQMVYEFPELQGIIGEYYAKEQGENVDVATSIKEHYLPVGEKSPLPESKLGTIMALADKLDTLWGCFASGLIPTSTTDPLGLRRQAIGIIRISIEKNYLFSLSKTWEKCIEIYGNSIKYNKEVEEIKAMIDEFIIGRIRSYFQSTGHKKDTIEAVLSAGYDCIGDVGLRVKALEDVRNSEGFGNLAIAFKRAFNIVAKEYKGGEVNPQLFVHDAEKNLFNAIEEVEKQIIQLTDERKYNEALKLVGNTLRTPIDTFFDNEKGVFVMDENMNLRKNRLALLNRVSSLVRRIAFFNQLQFSI